MYPPGISELSNQISSIRNSTAIRSRARANWFRRTPGRTPLRCSDFLIERFEGNFFLEFLLQD
jgi:hypothetical protein